MSGLDDAKIELARLMDRFPLQVHLEPSDISEVTSRRVLLKNAPAETELGKLHEEHRGRLTDHISIPSVLPLPSSLPRAISRSRRSTTTVSFTQGGRRAAVYRHPSDSLQVRIEVVHKAWQHDPATTLAAFNVVPPQFDQSRPKP